MDRKSVYSFLSLLTLFSFFILNSANLAHAISSTIVISEVQIAGINTSDDFIELRNLTDQDINLEDYKLLKHTSGNTESSIKAFSASDIIPASGYYLWSNSGWEPSVTPDSSTSASLAGDNAIALALDSGEIVDSVGWGASTSLFVETSVFPTNPPAGQSIERVGNDTDNNSVDFVLRESPDPQNTASVSASPLPSVEPSPSPEVSPSPEPSPSPSPSVQPSVEPSPSVTPSVEPSPSPVVSPTPSVEPSPSIEPSPSNTPRGRGRVIGTFFGTRGRVRECSLEYKVVHTRFFTLRIPKISCEWL